MLMQSVCIDHSMKFRKCSYLRFIVLSVRIRHSMKVFCTMFIASLMCPHARCYWGRVTVLDRAHACTLFWYTYYQVPNHLYMYRELILGKKTCSDLIV